MAIQKRKTFFLLEYGYMVLALLLISDALTPLLNFGHGSSALDTDDSNPLRLAIALALYAIAAVALTQRVRTARAIVIRRPELVLLICWMLLSILWSGNAIPVGRRALAQVLTVIFCLFVTTRYSRPEFFERALVALFIGGFASVILCLVAPSIAVHHDSGLNGAWHGVYPHKASAGRVAVFGILLCLLIKPDTKVVRALRWPTLASLSILLAMSQSRTSWLEVIGCLGMYAMMKVFLLGRIEKRLRIAMGITTVVLGAVIAASGFVFVLTEMGRDLTFSGRTSLWAAAIQVSLMHHSSFLGVGYRNFWLGESVNQILPYIAGWAKTPGHGHNGYLDMWLELGWVGLGLLLVFIVRNIIALVKMQARRPGDSTRALLFLAFLQFVVANVAVTVALTHSDLAWCLAMLGAFYSAYDELKFHVVAQRKTARSIANIRRRPKLQQSY